MVTRPPTDLAGFPDPATDPVAARLRRALQQEAAVVQPSPGSLAEIRERVDAERGPGRWLPVLAAAAAVVVVGGVAAAVLGEGPDEGAAPAGPTSSATSTGTSEPAPSTTEPSSTSEPTPSGSSTAPAGEVTVPVYWVGPTKTTFLLYREFQRATGADPVVAVVETMLAGEPTDPDYENPWSPASVSVESDGEELVVDLGSEAFAEGVGSEVAEVALQQLVWTATAAAQSDVPVRVLVDGQAGYDAWGVVSLDEPLRRDADVQAPTWVLEPVEGAVVEGDRVTVSGEGVAFEGTLLWEVADASGTVVQEGFTTAGGSERMPFTFDVVGLEPGEYEVVVYAPDESGGESAEGPRLFPDSKSFTIR